MMSNLCPSPQPLPSTQRQEVLSLLQQCKLHAGEAAPSRESSATVPTSNASAPLIEVLSTDDGADGECASTSPYDSRQLFISSLQSLHQALISLGPSPTVSSATLSTSLTRTSSNSNSTLDGIENEDSLGVFLHNIANELVHMDRVISSSIDEEINGPFLHSSYCTSGDCKMWTSDIVDTLGQLRTQNGASKEDKKITEGQIVDPKLWVDRCLDVCGYGISLEVAVACLRQVARPSSDNATRSGLLVESILPAKREKYPGVVAVVTSLRTVRRRLLLFPSQQYNEEGSHSLPVTSSLRSTSHHNTLNENKMNHLLECITLPYEYYQQNNMPSFSTDNVLLSESLTTLATTVLPSLVSSACHKMDLPLPNWATPKQYQSVLLHSAFMMAMTGDLLLQWFELDQFIDCGLGDQLSTIRTATSTHFQSLVKHLLMGQQRSGIIARQLYTMWKSLESSTIEQQDNTRNSNFKQPREILCRLFQSAIVSTSSKREVSMFVRGLMYHIAKVESIKDDEDDSETICDTICREKVLPFLSDLLLPVLTRDVELRESLVNCIILSPPTSFYKLTASGYIGSKSLHLVDLIVPRCLSQLLASACTNEMASATVLDVSAGETRQEANGLNFSNSLFLAHVSDVASVWCEDTFITRSDALQQEYVSEFLLCSLESGFIDEDTIKLGLGDAGTALAALFVQGVSLRLEVSRGVSIRLDGMRVAEKMASILGQTLRFDELHPPGNGVGLSGGIDDAANNNIKSSPKKKPAAPAILDLGAGFVSNKDGASDNDDSSSQSDSSLHSIESDNSSWGDDSLQPYSLNDDEEDLRRVARPTTLRDCFAYLLTPENDTHAYDKHRSALLELPTLVASRPLDLMDMVPTLVRILLHMEDKFSMDGFAENRWESLVAFGVQAPLETCLRLVEEMKGNVSLGTRLEALSVFGYVAEDLSGIRKLKENRLADGSEKQE